MSIKAFSINAVNKVTRKDGLNHQINAVREQLKNLSLPKENLLEAHKKLQSLFSLFNSLEK
jgi:hypothetical protein